MPKDDSSPTQDRIIVRRRDLYEAVVLETGVRNGEARMVIESLLECIHRALDQGAEIHVPPLGQIRPITRMTKDGEHTIYKLNLTKVQKTTLF